MSLKKFKYKFDVSTLTAGDYKLRITYKTNPNDEIMTKDTCYLTDEETKLRNKLIEEKNKTYIEGFGYVAPSKTKTIIVDSNGDINKMVGTME